MKPTRFLGRVTLGMTIAALVLSPLAGWLGGHAAALGVIAGVALGLGSLWWLGAAVMTLSASGGPLRWSASAALRFASLALATVLLLVSGLAHPVAIIVGLTVLPVALVAHGLHAAQTGSE
jgi:hypothetical protein